MLVFGLIHLFDSCQRCHSASHQRRSHFFVFLELRRGLCGHGGFIKGGLPFTVPAVGEVIGRGRHVIVGCWGNVIRSGIRQLAAAFARASVESAWDVESVVGREQLSV
jgi:hypothetical protein